MVLPVLLQHATNLSWRAGFVATYKVSSAAWQDSKFFFNLYDAPAKLINRYNEVAFKAT
jgi:hypothetical protein